MPFPIRASSYLTTSASSGFSMTLTLPTGTSVGDVVVCFGVNNTIGILGPSGWTLLASGDFFGQGIAYAAYSKTMTSADISAGSATFTLGFPISAGQQVWGVVATNGAAVIRESSFSHNANGSGGSQTVGTTSAVASGDTAILFCGIVGNAIATVTPGTTLGTTSASNASGIIANVNSLSSGVNTFTFGGGGTFANFQINVVLYSGLPPALGISCGSPPAGVKGSPYAHSFPASGGTTPYTFAKTAGTFPPGLTLNTSTGALTGTPTSSGTYSFTIQVADSAMPTPSTASVPCSIIIGGAGKWIIQEVTGELMPAQKPFPGGGRYRTTVRLINQAQAGTYQDFWNDLGGGTEISGSAGVGGVSSVADGAPGQPPGSQVTVAVSGVVAGTEAEINFIPATGATITALDDPTDGRVNVTIGAASVGGVVLPPSNYTASVTDDGKLISFNSSSPLTLTLPNPTPSSTWFIAVENVGSGLLTISRNGLDIDGAAANFTLNQNNGAFVFSDGTNYWTERGSGGTITTINMSVPPELTVSGVPSSGPVVSIVIGKATEAAATFWRGPVSGAAAQPVFGPIVSSDLPAVASYQATMKYTTSWVSQPNFTVTHGLNTTAVIVQVFDGSGNLVNTRITITGTNTVFLDFGGVSFTGSVVVIGAGTYSANSIYTTSWTLQTSETVSHGLGTTSVVIDVYDATGLQVDPDTVTIVDPNNIDMTFSPAFTGSAVVAKATPQVIPVQSYTISWSSQTSVTVSHGLNTTAVIVQVFNAAGLEDQAANVNVTSSTVVTLSFAPAFTGSVVVIG